MEYPHKIGDELSFVTRKRTSKTCVSLTQHSGVIRAFRCVKQAFVKEGKKLGEWVDLEELDYLK